MLKLGRNNRQGITGLTGITDLSLHRKKSIIGERTVGWVTSTCMASSVEDKSS